MKLLKDASVKPKQREKVTSAQHRAPSLFLSYKPKTKKEEKIQENKVFLRICGGIIGLQSFFKSPTPHH